MKITKRKSSLTTALPPAQGVCRPAAADRDAAPSSPTLRRKGPSGEMIVVRTERRSWVTVVITAFGGLLVRYLRHIRERTIHKPS